MNIVYQKFSLLFLVVVVFQSQLTVWGQQKIGNILSINSKLKTSISQISSINPNDTNYSDLKSIAKAIGKSRIVILSEPTHGDGEVFYAKARLVKFLHQKLGFDVIAWEAGQYDMEVVNQALNNTSLKIDEIEDRGLLSFWKKCLQIRPTIEYVRSTRSIASPIIMAGFDPQLTAKDKMQWITALISFIDQTDSALLPIDLRNELLESYKSFGSGGNQIEKEERTLSAIKRLAVFFETNVTRFSAFHGQEKVALMERTIQDQIVQRQYLKDNLGKPFNVTMNNPRDKRMADNIIWLAKNRYPKKKIIIWIASLHALYNPQSIYDLTSNQILKGVETTGVFLKKEFGKNVFSLGFTSFEGQFGAVFSKTPSDLPPPENNSLESHLGNMKLDYAFINLSKSASNKSFSDEFLARPLGYEFTKTNWASQMDGLIYIRKMTPSLPIN